MTIARGDLVEFLPESVIDHGQISPEDVSESDSPATKVAGVLECAPFRCLSGSQ
jgi:hypothetical protein